MTRPFRAGDDPRPTCDAIIGQRAGTFGFEYVFCEQVVGVSSYWMKRTRHLPTDTLVSYCSIPGHESNVRRRHAEQVEPPEPVWLEDVPEYADDMTYAKWSAERETETFA